VRRYDKAGAWVCVAVLAASAACSRAATEEQKRQSAELLAEAAANARKLDAERQEKLAAAVQRAPDPNGAPCGMKINGSWDIRIERVSAARAGHTEGPRYLYIAKEAERVTSLMGMKDPWKGNEPKRLVEYSGELRTPDWWEWDLTLIEEQRVAPGDTTWQTRERSFDRVGAFRTGAVTGRAYLYSYRDRRVVCAGTFGATNSSNIEIPARTYIPGAPEPTERENTATAAVRASWDLDRESGYAAAAALRAFPP
jgi:hypothetical protein